MISCIMALCMVLADFLLKVILLLGSVLIAIKIYAVATVGKYAGSQEMTGKTVIITGGNSGIGKETAKDLARRKARVIIACRNLEKARRAAQEILEDTHQHVVIKSLDLGSLTSVREFANDIMNTEPRLDVLINNAGVTNVGKEPEQTEDNCEPCLQTNYIGHFLLTMLLAGVTVNALHPGVVQTDLINSGNGIPGAIARTLGLLYGKTPLEGAQTSVYAAVDPELQHVTGKYFTDCRMGTPKHLDEKEEESVFQITAKIVGLGESELDAVFDE